MRQNCILIVEDEPNVAFFLKEGLEVLGQEYQVLVADSAEAALGLLEERVPDLLVTDLRLPGMNGLDLVWILQERGLTLPVLLITAYGSDLVETRAARLGISAILSKPFGLQVFLEQVMALLKTAVPVAELP